jgi:DNA invertase Pin-like site-specific DNA recombinase
VRSLTGVTTRQISLSGGYLCDPTDAVGRLLFNVLAMAADSDLIRLRTREGTEPADTSRRCWNDHRKRIRLR